MLFPLKFNCPLCGHSEKVCESIADEEKEKGKMRKELPFGSTAVTLVIADPTKPALSHPAITVVCDYCANCGHEYISEIRRTTATATTNLPGQKLPPGHRFG